MGVFIVAVAGALVAAVAVLMLGIVRTARTPDGPVKTLDRLAQTRERLGSARFDAWLAGACLMICVGALAGSWMILRG